MALRSTASGWAEHRCHVCQAQVVDTFPVEACRDCLEVVEEVAFVHAHPGGRGWGRRLELLALVALCWYVTVATVIGSWTLFCRLL